ncbi:hypothetical protein A2765_06130 [Candidatus Kaiserbacteria bacterium RIFCSPHIGHO2_01_FULL_56_24]|uniref:DNA methylase N-4/N-6 domain-containing protein n=1 Tax=Candidatus Kaiserbacteria bacterium RIFCSPHIGHO2_01_FULL_56_24 TaxID=1798487 RepID=A0A1F6D8C9_9BACT|nr:MAG: hypothetical protein A2765_06130 [Candidatus Kaiserbacteria bacterium RIFCSPHIGHO2_01_FULL_56_24]
MEVLAPALPVVKNPTSKKNSDAQKFVNGEVHNWYRIILGYSDHLVSHLLDEFKIQPGQIVLDPFCGTGTTLIESKKRGVEAIGIDANPSSCFAARVKTNWSPNPQTLLDLIEPLTENYSRHERTKRLAQNDPTYAYLKESGMLKRGWISPRPLRKVLAMKAAIIDLKTQKKYRDLLTLSLISEVVSSASNVKFGPELYCGKAKKDHDVLSGVTKRIQTMVDDLKKTSLVKNVPTTVLEGDARYCGKILHASLLERKVDVIICSPPYPTEHDYTRNSRLELALLEEVRDRLSLQRIKRQMVRSHTKGIYVEDNDSDLVKDYLLINKIATQIEKKAAKKKHGFARLYSKVLKEYFGGMKRHFSEVKPLLAPGAFCAYVVGDQSSYLRVHIPTAQILSAIATEVGFEPVDIRTWRTRWSTTTSRKIEENILIFRNPSINNEKRENKSK